MRDCLFNYDIIFEIRESGKVFTYPTRIRNLLTTYTNQRKEDRSCKRGDVDVSPNKYERMLRKSQSTSVDRCTVSWYILLSINSIHVSPQQSLTSTHGSKKAVLLFQSTYPSTVPTTIPTHNPIYRFKPPRRSRQSKRNTEMHRNTSKLYRHNFASTNISYLLAIQPDDQKSNQPYPFPFTPPHSPHSIPFFHHFHSFQSLHIIFSYRFTPNPLPTQPDLKPINQ